MDLFKKLTVIACATCVAFTAQLSGDVATMLVGIDYKGTSSELHNCIHDVEHVFDKLLGPKMDVRKEDVIYMTDHEGGENYPTKENLRKQIKNFVQNVNREGRGFFYYSGHGSYMTDDNGDELDRRDEALCPVDFSYHGFLRDDELFDNLVCSLLRDSKLIIATDCCYSGTIMDLPYKYNTDGSYILQSKMSQNTLDSLADVVMISGCRDDQVSLDGGFMKNDTKGSGAMTAAYLETLFHYGFNLTYRQLITKMHEMLIQHGYSQRPVLSTTRQINLDDYFMSTRVEMMP